MAVLTETEIEALRVLAEKFIQTNSSSTTLNETLGAGASAAVFELKDGSTTRALKVYSPEFFKSDGGPAELRRVKLQETLIGHGCASLVQLHRVSSFEQTCFVEMEHVGGFDLHQVLDKIPRAAIQPLIHQLVTAVRYLEGVGLVHRDIKPHNIRVAADFKTLKLLDLGVVRKFEHDSGPDATAQGPRKPFIATAQYSSPEYLFWLHPPSQDLWHALSIYQVGAVLHDLITGRLLFADEVATENRYALAMAVLQKMPSTHADDVPLWLRALAARCLTKDMNRRLAMVSWEDFQNPSNLLSTTVQRFQQVRTTGIAPTESGLSQHARAIRRGELMDTVTEQLVTRIRGTVEGCQLERISDKNTCVLVLRIPNTSLRVDYVVDFRWSEIAQEDSAAVFTQAQVRPDSMPRSTELACYDTCTVDGNTIDSAVDVLLSRFVEQIGSALEVAQVTGGELSAAVSLERTAS